MRENVGVPGEDIGRAGAIGLGNLGSMWPTTTAGWKAEKTKEKQGMMAE